VNGVAFINVKFPIESASADMLDAPYVVSVRRNATNSMKHQTGRKETYDSERTSLLRLGCSTAGLQLLVPLCALTQFQQVEMGNLT
jgi:hypothetical protein